MLRDASSTTAASTEVAVEEPLEIRVDGEPLAVTMRTPGPRRGAGARLPPRRGADRRRRARPGRPADLAANIVEVDGPAARATPASGASTRPPPAGSAARARSRRSRCTRPRLGAGPAGRARRCSPTCPSGSRQPAFERTGGLHATGLFDAAGELLLRPRGRRPPQRDGQGDRPGAARRPLPLAGLASSASAAGSRSSWSRRRRSPACPILVGVGAPTSLAIELARDRGDDAAAASPAAAVNVYADSDRVG